MQTSPTQATYPHAATRPTPEFTQFPTSPTVVSHPQNGMTPAYQPQVQEYSPHQAPSAPQAMTYYASHSTLPSAPQNASELDAHYWKNMFLELGFGENNETQTNVLAVATRDSRNAAQGSTTAYSLDPHHHHHQPHPSQMHQTPQMAYHPMHAPHPSIQQVSVHPGYNH